MSLSRRARRGISIFHKIQMTGKRALYHLKPATMIDLDFKDAVRRVMDKHTETFTKLAALEAMEKLVANGEKANELQTVPDQVNNADAPIEEGVTECYIPSESQDGEGC